MERYDYRKAVLEDIRTYLNENNFQPSDYDYDRDSAFENLNEELWVADSVTGNGSGSYTFSTWEAEENLCHNLELLMEAMEGLGCKPYDFKGAEWGDVTIRCYLLNECLDSILDEYDWEEECVWDDPDEEDDMEDE